MSIHGSPRGYGQGQGVGWADIANPGAKPLAIFHPGKIAILVGAIEPVQLYAVDTYALFLEQQGHQVMRERPGSIETLEAHQYGSRLRRANRDATLPASTVFLEQHDGHVIL